MPLSKLMILSEGPSGNLDQLIVVAFNPNRLRIQKTATWRRVRRGARDTQPSQFVGGEPATLTVDLFFDTSEDLIKDVQLHTRRIFRLTTVEGHGELHRPPLCRLSWGLFTFDDNLWVLQSVDQSFTLFRFDGIPLRATLACNFRQWRGDQEEARLLRTSSPDVAKSRVVQRGETLSSIAAEEYKDPGLWRPIAEANGIDNPRRLEPGRVLAIPALRPGRGERR